MESKIQQQMYVSLNYLCGKVHCEFDKFMQRATTLSTAFNSVGSYLSFTTEQAVKHKFIDQVVSPSFCRGTCEQYQCISNVGAVFSEKLGVHVYIDHRGTIWCPSLKKHMGWMGCGIILGSAFYTNLKLTPRTLSLLPTLATADELPDNEVPVETAGVRKAMHPLSTFVIY